MIIPSATRIRPHRPSRAGMTLPEVMVAAVIGGILLLALAGVLGQTSEIYGETGKSVEWNRGGRAAVGILRRDMEGFLPLGLPDLPPVHWEYHPDTMTTRVGFFTCLPANAQERREAANGGDLCHVLYYTALTPDSYGGVSRKLFRKLTGGSEVARRLSQPPFEPPAPTPEDDDVVAFDVLDFRADFRHRAGPGGAWISIGNPADVHAAEEMVLHLRLLAGEAARALEDEEDWLPGSNKARGFDFDAEEDDDPLVRGFRVRHALRP